MLKSIFQNKNEDIYPQVVNVELYQQMIRCLLYIVGRSRPDIIVAVNIFSRFQKEPSTYCHRAAKRISRYLKEAFSYGIKYLPGVIELDTFADAEYAGDLLK